MGFVFFIAALFGIYLSGAFITPSTSYSTDQWIIGFGAAFALVAAAAAVWLTRNPFASVAVLPAVILAVLVGNYLPYELGIWDLSVQDYASSEESAATRLAFLSAWSLLGTIALGLAVGLITHSAHSWISPETGEDSRRGLHPG